MDNLQSSEDPTGDYMFKVKNRNTRAKLTIKTYFEHVSHLAIVFLFLTLNR